MILYSSSWELSDLHNRVCRSLHQLLSKHHIYLQIHSEQQRIRQSLPSVTQHSLILHVVVVGENMEASAQDIHLCSTCCKWYWGLTIHTLSFLQHRCRVNLLIHSACSHHPILGLSTSFRIEIPGQELIIILPNKNITSKKICSLTKPKYQYGLNHGKWMRLLTMRRRFGSAPWFSNSCTQSRCPAAAANNSGVVPSLK